MVDEGTTRLTLNDGRTLTVDVAGDVAGRPIVVHNGTPSSRQLYPPDVDAARERGAFLVSWDRPGYGGSSPHPGRTVADVVRDTQEVAAALGLGRLLVTGSSGGGPHALACAALLPDQATAVAVVASPAPWGAAGLDYYDGMGALNVEADALYRADPVAARERSREEWAAFSEATPEQLREGLASLLAPVDSAFLTAQLAEFLAASTHAGLAPGDQGWWDDGVALAEPWGFELGVVTVPVRLWHGGQDRFVPVAHGRWLAGHVPGCEASITEADGHLSLLARTGEVFDWLLAHD